MQEGCGFKSDLCGVRIDARQRRIRNFAFYRVVIDAEHRHFLGHGNAVGVAGVQHLIVAGVVAGEERDRFGQVMKPFRQRTAVLHGVLFDVRCSLQVLFQRGMAIDEGPYSLSFQFLREIRFTLLRKRHLGIPAISEVLKAPLLKMANGLQSDLLMVGDDAREMPQFIFTVNVHRWKIHATHLAFEFRAVDSCQNSVGPPAFESIGQRASRHPFLQEEQPGTVFARIIGDPCAIVRVQTSATIQSAVRCVMRQPRREVPTVLKEPVPSFVLCTATGETLLPR